MSFNRLKYDVSVQNLDNVTAQKSCKYHLDNPVSKKACYQANPRIIGQKGGVSLNKNSLWRFYAGPVDIESELKNLNRSASKNPKAQYNPLKDKCRDSKKCVVNMPNCYFPTNDTRLNNPSSNLRGININRFNPLCKNPQDNVFFPGTKNTSTRLQSKDNYKQKLPTPRINSLDPNMKKHICEKIKNYNSCAAPTHALYQYDKCG